MDFKYKHAITALNSLQSCQSSLNQHRAERSRRPERSLLQTAHCLRHLGLTQHHLDQLRVVHVAGTKGKGSTCALTESLLRHHGYRTGFFSSPHLVAARERIRVDGQPISEEKFASYFWEVYDRLELAKDADESMPMYFTFLTLMSLYVFVREQVDVAVMEVGIGGTYDCTNVIRRPVVCGITHLDYDHTDVLGCRIEQIAGQKAGIIKPGVPTFVGQQRHNAVMSVLADRAHQCRSPLLTVPDLDEYRSTDGGPPILGTPGPYQQQNAALALQLAHFWRAAAGDDAVTPTSLTCPPSETSMLARATPHQLSAVEVRALADCRWPGRCQRVSRGAVQYYLDGAHTTGSVDLALRWFQTQAPLDAPAGPPPRTVLLFYSTGSRDPSSLLPSLAAQPWDEVIFCPNVVHTVQDASSDQTSRLLTADTCESRLRAHCTAWRQLVPPRSWSSAPLRQLPCISDAINAIESDYDGATQVLVVGSLYLVGGLLSIIDPELTSVAPPTIPRPLVDCRPVKRRLGTPGRVI